MGQGPSNKPPEAEGDDRCRRICLLAGASRSTVPQMRDAVIIPRPYFLDTEKAGTTQPGAVLYEKQQKALRVNYRRAHIAADDSESPAGSSRDRCSHSFIVETDGTLFERRHPRGTGQGGGAGRLGRLHEG